MQDRFEQLEFSTLEKLTAALEARKVDIRAIPVIELVNQLPDAFTTSSCAGRIQLLTADEVGHKKSAKRLGIWHEPPGVETIEEAISQWNQHGILMIMQQPALFHITCRDIASADELVRFGISAGFKQSSIRTIAEDHVRIEWLDTGRLDIPVGIDGKIIVGLEGRSDLVQLANRALRRAIERLHRLELALTNRLGSKDA